MEVEGRPEEPIDFEEVGTPADAVGVDSCLGLNIEAADSSESVAHHLVDDTAGAAKSNTAADSVAGIVALEAVGSSQAGIEDIAGKTRDGSSRYLALAVRE